MAITLYSSGPMVPFGSGSTAGELNVVNLNSTDSVVARIRLFKLNGTRSLVFEGTLSVESFSSDVFQGIPANEALGRYEITVRLDTPGNVDLVLISYWGRALGTTIDSLRVLHEEFHRLPFTFESPQN